MADFKPCWLKTAHERHGWTEVVNATETRLVSMVDASTVLSVPGARYHLCEGVPDIEAVTKALGVYRHDPYETTYIAGEHIVGGIRVRTERRVTLSGIYERVVREDVEWRLLQQLTCFCCSCDDQGMDHFCRNHGGQWGMRPCEEHGVEGATIIDFDIDTGLEQDTGKMPDSVQAIRRIQSEERAFDNGG